MRLEYYPLDQLKKELLYIIGKYVDLETHRVFFFGSRVTGKGDERSDIDVGIEGPKKIPFESLAKIESEVDGLPMLYKIDVVDFKSTSDKFKKVSNEAIELINDI